MRRTKILFLILCLTLIFAGCSKEPEIVIVEDEELLGHFNGVYGTKPYDQAVPDTQVYIDAELDALEAIFEAMEIVDGKKLGLPKNYEELYIEWRAETDATLKEGIKGFYPMTYAEAFEYVDSLETQDEQLAAEVAKLAEIIKEANITYCFDISQDYIDWRLAEHPWVDTSILWQEETVTMWATADGSVREQMDADSEKLGKFEMGDTIKVTGIGVNSAKGWYRVEFKGKTGYVDSKYLGREKVEKLDKDVKDPALSGGAVQMKPSTNDKDDDETPYVERDESEKKDTTIRPSSGSTINKDTSKKENNKKEETKKEDKKETSANKNNGNTISPDLDYTEEDILKAFEDLGINGGYDLDADNPYEW